MSTNTIDVRRFGIVLAATAVALGTWNVRDTHLAAHDGPHMVQYRVNAGGDAVPGSPNWSQDLAGAPSAHVNAVATGNTTHDTWLSIDVSHPSLPAGTPASLFQSERWDLPGAPAMQWKFPVTPGTYHVRLYFAEIYFTGMGERVFDVTIENDLVLDDYDIVADAGAFKGVMKSFTVTSDASLDIVFGHVVENPKISAIEILAPADNPGEIGIAPDSLEFGPVLVGQGGTRTVQVTNLGAAGAPNIDIYATTVTGSDASQFWDSFNDGTAVTLGPGQSMSITVGFAPISTGPKTAALEILHFGNNSPAVVPLTGAGTAVAAGTWQSRAPSGLPRQEVAYVHLGGKLYLAGGSAAHEDYDPATNTWAALMPLPVNVDHIQAVALGGRIYYIGGLLAWPTPASSAVHIYDPATDSFTQGAPMPRPRGAGGVAVHNGRIYYAGGLANGTAVNWFDVYDPLSNSWSVLPNMPVARDHFHAAVVGNRLYVTGGRDTTIEATISSTIAFDFSAGNWQAGLAPIPTPRGGFGAAVLGSEILVIGGEGGGLTYGTVEAYDTTTNTWRTLASMPTPRHGIQAAECNGSIYVAAGGATEGGATPTNVHEVFSLGSNSVCGAAPPAPPPPLPASGVLYRVNAGGGSVSGTPNWSADLVGAPSPYTNAAATGNTTGETWMAIDMTHPSIPAGTPASVFQTERWDLPDAPAMHWSFPVTAGTYQVRLYFAEFYVSSAGERVFDVFIEGNPVLTNYDIVADVGTLKAVMKSFTVTTDASLDIAFGHAVENPKVSAIEILGGTTSTGDLGVSPVSVSFGDVLVSQSASRSLQLTNLGGSGAPSIGINSTTITGTHASQFADSFNDAATVTLAPGQSTSITVTFTPSTTGSQIAALQVAHSGNNSPAVIPLSGTGVTGAPDPSGVWQTLAPSVLARHEISYVQFNGNFYLTGDRGYLENEVYNAGSNTWSMGAPLPAEFHHGQAVELNGLIYHLGGLVGPYPDHVTPEVYIFNPATGAWSVGTPMSAQRARGGGGTARYNGKLYLAGGLRDDATGTGHDGVSVALFDMYDPVQGSWTPLPDMPRARDHFHAAVVGDKFYAIGGRKGGDEDFFNAVIAPVDVYDFTTGAWSTLPAASNIPTPRAGIGVAVLGNEIVVIGGEGNGNAYDKVEAFNTANGTWRTLAPMPTPRHGIQAAVCNGAIYIAAGAASQGGSNLTNVHQVFFLGNATGCASGAPPPPPPSSAALYRVNAGGGSVSGTPNWSADSGGAPSPYVNAAATGNTTYETSMAIGMSHASLPGGTPAGLFQSERWDLPGAPEMQWSFPVTPGTYQVRLYFAEIFFGSTGERVFDVSIEGSPVLSAYDIVADVGVFKGVMKSFTVTSDASLDVVLGHVVENPKISAIEVLDATPRPGQLGASPASVAFGMVLLGQSTTRTVQLTNLGGSGAPDIHIDATTITGIHASEFGDNFNDAGTVTLAPGQSMALTVSFLATSAGSKTADLQIAYSGNNSPLVIPLGANATTTSTIGFGKSTLSGMPPFSLISPTSLQFGPDGRLYVGQQDGLIRIYTVTRNAANSYVVASSETIDSINSVPNHDDSGVVNPDVTTRLITGILVVGTAANPVIYVAHSDPRIGAGPSGEDLNLDTNSSMISRLRWNGSSWHTLDLVRGLPRSEENHAANGMQLDPTKNILYVAMGGNTNKGATSHHFAYLPEFALSAAILSIDLTAIGGTTYDLPTLDDETRPGNPDPGDPFGGNNGKNQAILVPGGPVQVYAPGFRNPYDLVLTQSGRLYTVDNGGNAGWGDAPIGSGPAGVCTNAPNEAGTTSPDSLHLIAGPGYYGGHPNPTRGNTANTFNTSNPQSPVSLANPVECEYREAGAASGALAVFPESTNGLTEYTSANFGGAMQGNLLAVSWDNVLYRIQLDATGTATHVSPLFSTIGALPLDVDTLGMDAPFPGTIWISDYWTNQIFVFEPNDYEAVAPSCTGAYDWNRDEDLDGYSNADEIDNGTNACSAGDVPPDWDGDFISDLNDPDDDNDGIPDVSDPFALDPLNGTGTRLPVFYGWENDGSAPGGILNLGFTGLMTNGVSNYAALYDRTRMTAGGAAGVLTVDRVSEGDAFGALNNQEYGLQFGLWANPADTDVFFVHTRILAPFSGLTPHDGQAMGLFVGTGDQDNYAKIVVTGSFGGGIAFLPEVGGATGPEVFASVALPGPTAIDLYLRVDPDNSTVQPFYSLTSGGVTGPQIAVALPQQVPSNWFTSPLSGLAVGIISTSRGPGPEFPATWDFIRALPATAPPPLAVSPSTAGFGSVMIGETRSLTLQLSNPGGAASADLVVNSTTITGAGAGQFSDSFDDAAAVTLAPGEATTVTVTFAPEAAGSTSATLAIGHSGASAPVLVPLTGTGVTSAAPTLGVSPTSLSFGDVPIGQSTGLDVTLTNVGTSDIAVQSTTVTGTHAPEFSNDFSGPLTLGAGETVALMVTFTPSSSGSRTAALEIAHSGGNTPVAVSLEGSGVMAAAPALGVSPASLSFGNVTVGQEASLPAQLTNLGTTDLLVGAVSVSGAQADQFTVAPEDGSMMLAPGSSTTVHVTFAPTSPGSKSGTLEVKRSGANSPVLVPLGGTGSNRRR